MSAIAVSPLSYDQLRPVRVWLVLVAVVVAIMVLVGGATRLTDSGLSITEWAPIRGAIPPLSVADWMIEFEKYKTTTEFQTINSSMTLDQFKFIYWWEWGHRFLGRLIGLLFALPLVFFWWTGRLTPWLKPRLLLLLALGGLQGAVGWWMVKSGLVNRVDVSQIRLAVHLTLACVIFAYTIWVLRSLTRHDGYPAFGFGRQSAVIVFLVLAQIFLGGLVAGLDAGMAYNTWPSMNGELLPSAALAIEPIWRNFVDNAAMVQFLHRICAYLIVIAVLVHAFLITQSNPETSHSRRAIFLVTLVSVQAVLGIATLIMQVPMNWALIHQLGALVVLAFAIAHWRAFSMGDDNQTAIA